MSSTKNNEQAFAAAKKVIPGGVNSPVRAFKSVGGTPRFMKSAKGSKMVDIEGKTYIDYIGSWGPMILGHNDPRVIESIQTVMQDGLSFGAPTELETVLAELIVKRIDAIEMVRMCSSGTEATMSAIRLARGYTRRDKIIKFEGCYHGHSDSLLVKAGSGALSLGVPTSPGVPADFAKHTLTLSFNDSEELKAAFAEHGKDIAAVIVEPIAGNMNLILPNRAFLDTIRQCCDDSGALFISDEVMTGFRVAHGGAAEFLGFTPDLVTFGKVIGGGMPVGAFAGKKEVMEHLSPVGGVYQAGTLSGNPVAMAAGIATLQALDEPNFYINLLAKTEKLASGLQKAADEAGVPFLAKHICGMFGLFFTKLDKVDSFADVMRCDGEAFKTFFHGMLDQGVYFAPHAFEAGFVSIAHSDADIEATVAAAKHVFKSMQ